MRFHAGLSVGSVQTPAAASKSSGGCGGSVATRSTGWPFCGLPLSRSFTQTREPPHATTAANLPPRVISTNQFKNGAHIEVDGTVFRIVEFQHVKPGKGGAFVRTKLKRVDDGAVIVRTFRAGEKFRPVRTESRKMKIGRAS